MLFIVKGSYTRTGYMNEPDAPVSVMHPVEAVDEDEARQIFVEHYEKKTDEYSVYYSAKVDSIFGTLTKG